LDLALLTKWPVFLQNLSGNPVGHPKIFGLATLLIEHIEVADEFMTSKNRFNAICHN